MTLIHEEHDLERPGEAWRRNCGADAEDALYAVSATGRRHRDRCEAPMLSLKWMVAGRAEYRFGRRNHRVEGGRLLLSAPGQIHDVELAGDGQKRSFCLFVPHPIARDMWTSVASAHGAQLDDPSHRLAPIFPEVTTGGWQDIARELAMLSARLHGGSGAGDIAEPLLLESLSRMRALSRSADRLAVVKPATRAELLRRLLAARDLIDADPARRPTLDSLAKEANLSRYHFLRCFARVFGETPGSYAARGRIAQAAQLLSTTRLPLVEIAAWAGFGSQSAFTRSFRRWRGMSPNAYRSAVRS